MTKVLTSSEVSVWQACRRQWWLSQYRKLGRDESFAFNTTSSIGNVYHAALEAYYGRGEDPVEFARLYYGQAILEAQEKLVAIELDTVISAIDKEAELVLIMLEGYVELVLEEGYDEDLEVLGAETRATEELTDDLVLQGKIDAPARKKSEPNVLLQIDHKTTGDLVSIPKTAQVNQQFLNYNLLAFLRARREGGQRTDGIVVNMARRVKRTARAKPPFYGRHEVRHSDEQLRSHWRHLLSVGQQILEATARLDRGENPHGVCPPTPTRDCTWRCPFSGPCLSGMFDDGSDVEGYLAANYVEIDPLARYKKEGEDGD